MPYPQIDRAKAWLDRSNLKDTNQPLWQTLIALIDTVRTLTQGIVAVEDSGGSGAGITALTGDVTATGPGVANATIQPNVVTYAKIQQVAALRLLGNPTGVPADVSEIELGDGLAFDGTALEVDLAPGVPGFDHDLLSEVHPDTEPASPVIGDIIRAVDGGVVDAKYVHAVMVAPIVEDFSGIRQAYTVGVPVAGNFASYYGFGGSFVVAELAETQLVAEFYDAFLQAPIVEDFTGIRATYMPGVTPGQFSFINGNNGAYAGMPIAFIPTPDPATEVHDALWERMAVGVEGDVLTVVDGVPAWQQPTGFPDQSWVDIPYSAGDFTAAGGVTPTWTVDNADVIRWQYQLSYDSEGVAVGIRYAIYLRSTTVGGTAPTQLLITIPIPIAGRYAEYVSIQENVTAVNDTFVEYDAGTSATTLFIQKVAGAVFDTTASGTFIGFEISAELP